jgi:hypothetical protein
MKRLLVLGFMLLSVNGWAQDKNNPDVQDEDQMVIDAGLGILGNKGPSLSQVKFAKIGYQETLWNALKQRFNGGGWLDSRGDGRTSSGFVGYQLGFEVQNDIFQASVWSGPGLISSPDVALGGPIQFNETIFFGIVNYRNESIGLAYNHWSSASLYAINQGRDFLGLEIKFPF